MLYLLLVLLDPHFPSERTLGGFYVLGRGTDTRTLALHTHQ